MRYDSKLRDYNTFGTDEFGLFYKLAPDFSIVPSRLAVRKRKRRLSLLANVNVQGTENLPPVFIAKSKASKELQWKDR